jgi:hypothetical protein
MQHILALSHSAVIVRHWFEIDLDDASREHGVRVELRELPPQPHPRQRISGAADHGRPPVLAGRSV